MINWNALGNFRTRLANIAGHTFRNKRDLYKALGYSRELFPWDYRARYERNAVANRVVKALPSSTWRGGGEVIENEDPNSETPFEAAWNDLEVRLKIWSIFLRADILAGIGRYSVILLGAPGKMEEPLEHCTPDQLMYLQPYAEEDATIREFDIDMESPRFGLPILYLVKRAAYTNMDAVNAVVVGKPIHHSRIIHIGDGLLDDKIYGEPRLKCVWNLIDDLEKVTGGGAEAFWKRADGGMQFDIDPLLDVDEPSLEKFRKDMDEYEHELRKNMLTRGMKINRLGSDVADFASPVNSIISQISAGTGIPQRVLMGSEQGKLAAKMDRSNWDDRVANRRDDYAGPHVVRPFVDRMIELGVMPKPVDDYDVVWPQLTILDDEQRANIAAAWAGLNKPGLPLMVTAAELRQRVLELPPMQDQTVMDPKEDLTTTEPVAASAKGGAPHHVAADRFRKRVPTRRERLLQRKSIRAAQEAARVSHPEPKRVENPGDARFGLDRIREELRG